MRRGAWSTWFITESLAPSSVPGTQGALNNIALSPHSEPSTALWAVTHLILEPLWAGVNPGMVGANTESISESLRKTPMIGSMRWKGCLGRGHAGEGRGA